jgi:hypothetical protein
LEGAEKLGKPDCGFRITLRQLPPFYAIGSH